MGTLGYRLAGISVIGGHRPSECHNGGAVYCAGTARRITGGGSSVAKRQGPRPTVRVSRDPGSTNPGSAPANPRPIRRQPAPKIAAQVDRGSQQGEITPLAARAQPILTPPVERAVGRMPVTPRTPPTRPSIRSQGERTSLLPQAAGFGERIGTLPSSLTVPGRATIAPPESTTRPPTPLVARSGASRTREAGLRLFGDYSYVKRDLRRIAILTISALVLLVVVSFLLPLWLK